MTDPRILASFTTARRQHEGLTPEELAARLDVPARQVRAAENGGFISARTRARLIQYNEISTDGGV